MTRQTWLGGGLDTIRALHPRAIGAERSYLRDQIVDDLVIRIMGPPDNEAVILRPSMASDRQGKWDVAEPHPHPDVPFAAH